MDIIHYKKEISIVGEYDILVCGGGVAGFCAAIAAARGGASVALLEKNRMLGGIMTAGGNNDIALFNAGTRPVIRGIGWEFSVRLREMGYAEFPEFQDGVTHSRQGVKVNIPMASYLMDTMCMEENVTLHFGATVTDAYYEANQWAVVYAEKGRLSAIRATYVIDCTGDGDASVCAGADYELGDPETGALQPGTLRFYPSQFHADGITPEQMRASYTEQVRTGTILESDFWPGERGNPCEIFTHHGDNINHIELNADYMQKTSEIEMEGRKSLFRISQWVRQETSAKNFCMESLCDGVAFRETRRILCDAYVTVQDYVQARIWDDSICYAYYPVDLHCHAKDSIKNIFIGKDHIPTIPFRALVVAGLDNFLVAGRCVSSDRLANSALRVKAPCMAMGQAAGTAAALARKEGGNVRCIDVEKLKKCLKDAGCIVPEKNR